MTTFADHVAKLQSNDKAYDKKQRQLFWQKWEEDFNLRYATGLEYDPDDVDCF